MNLGVQRNKFGGLNNFRILWPRTNRCEPISRCTSSLLGRTTQEAFFWEKPRFFLPSRNHGCSINLSSTVSTPTQKKTMWQLTGWQPFYQAVTTAHTLFLQPRLFYTSSFFYFNRSYEALFFSTTPLSSGQITVATTYQARSLRSPRHIVVRRAHLI